MADQSKRIIFQDDGCLKVVVPPHDMDADLSWEQIARLFVPAGHFYTFVDIADIPSDRSQRAAWTVDRSDLKGRAGE